MNHKEMISFIREISGQANILTIPRIFLQLTQSHKAALLLSQCVYWSGKTKDPDGWFWKTHEEWESELGLTRRSLDSATDRLSRWLQTGVYKVGGTPKKHYRVEFDLLVSDISEMLKTDISDMSETYKSDMSKTYKSSITETTDSETTSEITLPARVARETIHELAVEIANVCGMEMQANSGRLYREARLLANVSPIPSPNDIRENYSGGGSWWSQYDWRGIKGQKPTPQFIRETWGQWVEQKSKEFDISKYDGYVFND